MRMFLSALVIGAAIGTPQPAPAQEPLVVKDVILPREASGNAFSLLDVAIPLGVVTDDHRAKALFNGESFGGAIATRDFLLSAGAGAADFKFRFLQSSSFDLQGIFWNPGFAILKTPSGINAVMRKQNSTLEFYSVPDGVLLGNLLPAPPAAGELPQSTWRAIWNAGDINSDGFDDVFFQSHSSGLVDGYSGLIDGATMTLVWRKYSYWSSDVRPMTSDPTLGYPDLNGDGVPDLVSGWNNAVPPYGTNDFHLQAIAYSGTDGALLWDAQVGPSDSWGGITGRDLNGDGIADTVGISVGITNALQAISGSDGSTLWSTDVSTVLPLIPGGGTYISFDNPAFFEDATDSMAVSTVSAMVEIKPPGEISDVHYVATFQAVDGQILSVSPLPTNLSPWTPDPVLPDNNLVHLLGDYDRDGYTEIVRHIDTPSLDPGGFWPSGYVTSLAILGPPTIELPNTVSLGQSHRVDFDIPSSEFKDVQLIISTGFDRDGGFEIDDWPTNLVADPLLSWYRANPMFTTLGPGGEGGFLFTLPNNPALIGLDLYFRGIVWEPSAPYQKVWTMSSLGQSVVVP